MKNVKNLKNENHLSTETEESITQPIPQTTVQEESPFNVIPENIKEDIKRFPRFFVGFYNRQLDGISNLHSPDNTIIMEQQVITQLKLRYAESFL